MFKILSNFIPGVGQIQAGLKFLPYIGIAALGLFALIQLTNARHWHKRYENSEKAHAATIAEYKSAQLVAAELNKGKVAQIEADRREVANDQDREIRKSIDLAVADARRVWAARTAEGVARRPDTGGNTTPSGSVTGEGGVSVMDEDDVRICTVNTVKLLGWQDFYDEVKTAGQ